MITAKELKEKSEKFREERQKELKKELKQFLIESEKKLIAAASKGNTHIFLRFPFTFLEMGTKEFNTEILNYYSYYGYKVTFVQGDSRSITVSWSE